MKKTLFLIFLVSASLTACKKKNCWKCTTKEVGGAATILPGSQATSKSTVCDKTEEEIRQWEKDNTGTETYEENGQQYTLTATTICE